MERLTRGALLLSLVLLAPAAAQHPDPFQQWQDAITASHLGVLKTYRGDFDGAIMQFNRLIQLHPYDAIAYYNRALAESAKRDFDKAVADFTRAIQLNPQFARAYSDLGLVKANQGDLDEAITDFNHAIELNPKFADAHNSLGTAKAIRGDLDGAIAEFNLAIQFDSGFAQAFDNLGSAKIRKGDLEGAVADFEQAIRLNPNDHRAFQEQGLCRQLAGDLPGALRALVLSSELLAPQAKDQDYLHLGIWVVRAKQGQMDAATGELLAYFHRRGSGSLGDWPARIGAFLLGQVDEAALLAAAGSTNPQSDRAQHCEAWYYAGIKRLLAGDNPGATDCFRNCLATGETQFDEYMLAQTELSRLEADDL